MGITEEDIFTPAQIREISNNSNNIRDQALFCVEYLTAGRVGEVCNRVRNYNIEYRMLGERKFMVIKLPHTEKRKDHISRAVPFPIDKEADLIEKIEAFRRLFSQDTILFPITIQRAWQIFDKMYDKRPIKRKTHILRHSRITHWITEYNLPAEQIMKLAGWSNLRPLSVYAHLRWQDAARLM